MVDALDKAVAPAEMNNQ
jgi:glyoxylase-like metal-dependent hydrolase (beta-lactamase superfamily II)/protein-S-isoprenylcysteine O-methyltransferase Ste14